MSKTQEIIDENMDKLRLIRQRYLDHAESYSDFMNHTYDDVYNLITYRGYLVRILALCHSGVITFTQDAFVETEKIFSDHEFSVLQKVHDDGSFTVQLMIDDMTYHDWVSKQLIGDAEEK